MIGSAMIRSAFVLAIAIFGLLAIWEYDRILECYRKIPDAGAWIATVAIVLSALVVIACSWWLVVKQGRKPRPHNGPCTLSDSPYPDPGWKRITGFWFKTDLCLARLKERDPRFGPEEQYLVARDYVVCVELDGSTVQVMTVKRGMVTDLASVPRVFRWFVSRVGPHLEASIVHDWLYVAWQKRELTPTDDMRLFSDKVMLAAMLASGMGCTAYIIYCAIRVFGTCIFYGRNREPYILEKCKMPDCCCDELPEVSDI
ncbi:MAG: DUF1353 domain-containing protein [Rhodospirillales bacterium]|nr:DUF1353 domain-containing protein [Rhodospirillales bacterium]